MLIIERRGWLLLLYGVVIVSSYMTGCSDKDSGGRATSHGELTSMETVERSSKEELWARLKSLVVRHVTRYCASERVTDPTLTFDEYATLLDLEPPEVSGTGVPGGPLVFLGPMSWTIENFDPNVPLEGPDLNDVLFIYFLGTPADDETRAYFIAVSGHVGSIPVASDGWQRLLELRRQVDEKATSSQ
jgi:hypothetical protein